MKNFDEEFERWFESEFGREPFSKYEREQLASEFVKLSKRLEILEDRRSYSHSYHTMKANALAVWNKLRSQQEGK